MSVHFLGDIKDWDESDNFEKRSFRHGFDMMFLTAVNLALKKEEFEDGVYSKKVGKIYSYFGDFLQMNYANRDCRRLLKRLRKHRNEVWTFLEEDVPFHNNDAEREIRRSVVNRKISCGNRSDPGARIQETLLTAIHTARMMGYNLLEIFLNPQQLTFDTS